VDTAAREAALAVLASLTPPTLATPSQVPSRARVVPTAGAAVPTPTSGPGGGGISLAPAPQGLPGVASPLDGGLGGAAPGPKRWLAIGIPTLQRPRNREYLEYTLERLVAQLPDSPSHPLYNQVRGHCIASGSLLVAGAHAHSPWVV
jgi:hypothetical protein